MRLRSRGPRLDPSLDIRVLQRPTLVQPKVPKPLQENPAEAIRRYSGSGSIAHEFRGSAGTPIFTLTNGGSALFNGSITAYANSSISGDLSLFNGIGGGTGALYCACSLTCTMQTVDNNGTDYVGVTNPANNGALYSRQLFIMFNTFTGFHRCFTNDELYNNDEPQKFKDEYVGRIVISIAPIIRTSSRDAGYIAKMV